MRRRNFTSFLSLLALQVITLALFHKQNVPVLWGKSPLLGFVLAVALFWLQKYKDLINQYYISQCNLCRLKHLILYCNRSLVHWIFKPTEKSTLPYRTALQCSWEDNLPWQLHEAQVAWREREVNGEVFFTSKHLKFSLQVWWMMELFKPPTTGK